MNATKILEWCLKFFCLTKMHKKYKNNVQKLTISPSGRHLFPVPVTWSDYEYFLSLLDGMLGYCRVALQYLIRLYPFIHLGGERHCENKVSCPRTQQNVPCPDQSGAERTKPRSNRASSVHKCQEKYFFRVAEWILQPVKYRGRRVNKVLQSQFFFSPRCWGINCSNCQIVK